MPEFLRLKGNTTCVPAVISECSVQNSLGVGDEVQLELHHHLPGGSAVPRFSHSLLSTFDGQEHGPGAASCPPGLTAEATAAAELSMWQPANASTWEQGVPWLPEISSDVSWVVAASSQVPGSWGGWEQLPGNYSPAVPPAAFVQELDATQSFRAHPKRQWESWREADIQNLLSELADWTLLDESHNKKLSQKGRGVWQLRDHHSGETWEMQELERRKLSMFSSFTGQDMLYEVPKTVKWAQTRGKHECLQKMLAIGSPEEKKHMASKLDGHIKELLTNQWGCLVLQQLLLEADKMVKRQPALTSGPSVVSHCVNSAILDSSDQAMADSVKVIVDVMKKALHLPQAIVDSSLDEHGNFVVQKWVHLLQQLPEMEELLSHTAEVAGDHIATMGANQTGCRVIQRLLETPSCYLVGILVCPDVFAQLVVDDFGNYIMGHLLDSQCPSHAEYKLAVLRNITDNFHQHAVDHNDTSQGHGTHSHDSFYLANTYACHVVKKCLLLPADTCNGWTEQRNKLLNIVLGGDGSPKPPFRCFIGTHDARMTEMFHVLLTGKLQQRSGRRSAHS